MLTNKYLSDLYKFKVLNVLKKIFSKINLLLKNFCFKDKCLF